MYFRNLRLQKAWVIKCRKSPCQNNNGHSACLKVQKTAEICTEVVFLYFLITLKELQFEKFFFSSI